VVVVAVILIIAGAVAYQQLTKSPATVCTLSSKNPLIWDSPPIRPDSFDPAVTLTTPGWGVTQQIYQGLVSYNGSSYTTFVPVLAQNWSVSQDGLHWNFTLRAGVHFSNGDAFNAYVMWYSLYRALVMDQAPQYLLSTNFWYPGLNYYSNATQVAAEVANLTAELNTWNFFNPTSQQIAIMEAPNESFRVLSNLTIQLNEGFGYLGPVPYSSLLPDIVSPVAYAVDPAFVNANGGVTAGGANTYLSTHTLGTGPFNLSIYSSTTGFTLIPNANYWGDAAAKAEPWNDAIQPAKSSSETVFQSDTGVEVSDMKTGAVAGATFGYAGATAAQELEGASCVVVQKLPQIYGSTEGNYWIFMDQSVPPFNNLSVRMAVAHAINMTQIIQVAFSGFAWPWVGPVPLAFPFYNPDNMTPYPYDPTLAKQEIADSPCASGCGPFNFDYLSSGTDWADMVQLIQTDLAQIGVKINPVPLGLSEIYEEYTVDPSTGVCVSHETTNGGPFPIGFGVYSADFVAPSDGTLTMAISWGEANVCNAHYSNATVDNLVYEAAASSSPSVQAQDYAAITQAMYDNYTNVWLAVVGTYAIYNPLVQGIVTNPMGSGQPFSMLMNTEYVS
jgi:peptide/nickel transport system substrate-binding protein